jgi:hypothetical protein
MTVFMKKDRSVWRCVDFGTWFSCEDLKQAGFPEAVRARCD